MEAICSLKNISSAAPILQSLLRTDSPGLRRCPRLEAAVTPHSHRALHLPHTDTD